jgi:hypothetical protein
MLQALATDADSNSTPFSKVKLEFARRNPFIAMLSRNF